MAAEPTLDGQPELDGVDELNETLENSYESLDNDDDIIGEEDEAPEEDTDDTDLLAPFPASTLAGPVVEENVQRFQALIRVMIKFIRDEAQTYGDKEWDKNERRAIAWSFVRFLRKRTLEYVVGAVIGMIPLPVQSILGRPDLEAANLLELPNIPEERTISGVYADIATLAATLAGSPAPDVEGTYVGSSVGLSYPGVRGRVKEHRKVSVRDYDKLPESLQTKHYRIICRKDVTPNFRLLAVVPATDCNRYPVGFAEGFMCIYLNTVSLTPSKHNPASTLDFAKRCRQHANESGHGSLPDFGGLGMNGASPLLQGMSVPDPLRKAHKEWAKTHPDVCGNPKCGKARYKKNPWKFVGFKEESRCPPCARYRDSEGVDDPSPRPALTKAASHRSSTYKDHLAWVAAGNPDVCQGCKEARPENWRDKRWVGFCKESLYQSCYKKKNSLTPKPPPPKHLAWVAAGNPDVCRNCKTARPKNYKDKGWIGFCEESRCRACYNETTTPPKKHQKWVTAGNPDICQDCRQARPRDYRAKKWVGFCEKSLCRKCNEKIRREKAKVSK